MPPYSHERDNWSIEATERLFPLIAESYLNTKPEGIKYAWNDIGIDRLDKDYGTDAILTTNQQRSIALAIRLRGVDYFTSFGDVTIRYDSLQTLGKKLEMQKSIARFMFYGWGDTNTPGTDNPKAPVGPPNNLVGWYLVFLQRLIDKFNKGELRHSKPFRNSDGSSRLVGIEISELNRHGLICKRMGDKSDNVIKTPLKVAKPQTHIQPLLITREMLREAQANERQHAYYND